MGLNFDHLLRGADFKLDVVAGIDTGVGGYTRQKGRLETFVVHAHSVGADLQVRRIELSGSARTGGEGGVGGGVGDHDLGAWNDGAGRVRDGSRDRSALGLREGRGGKQGCQDSR